MLTAGTFLMPFPNRLRLTHVHRVHCACEVEQREPKKSFPGLPGYTLRIKVYRSDSYALLSAFLLGHEALTE